MHLPVHGLQVAGGGDLAGLHPRFDLVPSGGGGGDLLLEPALTLGEVVHLRRDLGHGRAEHGLALPHLGQLGALGQRVDAVAQLIDGDVVVLDHHQGVEGFGHRSPLTLPRRGSPALRDPRVIRRAERRAPTSASSAMAAASSQVNHATSWLSPGPGTGSSSGAHTR